MSDFGWIKLHRVLMDWEWYKTPNMVQFWIHCLIKANHEERKWQGETILPGQFISGRETLAMETGLSEKQIRTCIEKLKSTNEMASKSSNKYTLFTIISWEKYQLTNNEGQQKGQQGASKGPAKGQQRATNKNDKNDKNEEEVLSEASSDVDLFGKKPGRKNDPIWDAVKNYWNYCPGGKSGKSAMGMVVSSLKNLGATPFSIWAVWHGYSIVRPDWEQANPITLAQTHFGRIREDLMKPENKSKLSQKVISQNIEIPFTAEERIWKCETTKTTENH